MEQQDSLTLQTSNALSVAVTSLPTFLTSLPEPLQKAWESGENIVSVEQAASLPGEQKIAKLQQVDETKTYKSIGRLLARMVYDMHIANGLSTSNIKNIAKRLTTDSEIRWWLTLADVDLLCRRIVEGYYGKFYGHFSETEFYNCLIQYCNERREIHRIQADRKPQMDASVLEEVGYKVDKHGNFSIPDAIKEKKLPPPLYIYDNNGRRIGDNPAAWKNKDNTERTDKVLALAKVFMKEDENLDMVDAIEKAAAIVEKQKTHSND